MIDNEEKERESIMNQCSSTLVNDEGRSNLGKYLEKKMLIARKCNSPMLQHHLPKLDKYAKISS